MGSIDIGLAQFLEDEGLGDFTSNPEDVSGEPAIVVGEMIDKPDSMISILPIQGPPPDRIVGTHRLFRIVTRGKGYVETRDLAELIHVTVNQHQGALDGEPVGRIQPEFTPVHLARDPTAIEGGRVKFTQTVRVIGR